MKELVLVTGRFAAVRKITLRDIAEARDDNSFIFCAKLASRCVTIDGEAFSVDDFLNMELEEFHAIMETLTRELKGATRFKKGIG